MTSIKTIKLNPFFLEKIKKISHLKSFTMASPLFYEGQIPNVAFLLLKGNIILFKKKKVKNIIQPGNLIGLEELMTNTKSKFSAEVAPDSTLCFLDKSTMLEIINSEKSDLEGVCKKMSETKASEGVVS